MDERRRLFLRGRPARVPEAAPRPPWALRPDDRFTSTCTRCGDCVRACPRQLLRGGDGGFPLIDFRQAGCHLCGDCARACATGALSPTASPEAFSWTVQPEQGCLAQRGVACRVCGDLCDTHALRFVPRLGGVMQVQVNASACTGCGACVPACPVGALRRVVRAA